VRIENSSSKLRSGHLGYLAGLYLGRNSWSVSSVTILFLLFGTPTYPKQAVHVSPSRYVVEIYTGLCELVEIFARVEEGL
jgi:hypothetical protein